MYKIRVIWLGKSQETYVRDGINLYTKKLTPYVKTELQELKAAPYSTGMLQQNRQDETRKVITLLEPGETSVFLDENGSVWSSVQLSQWFEQQKRVQFSRINFLIGGAYGWAQEMIPQGALKLSLSPMTFNHQMVRIILLEQIYRAFTILNGEPYHH
ncbi:MAG: 23S rRNA (pseudouridine(1915)-N(3))-methyltransferase RlmH [SAR324 cluster bacterium]|nr:23S rRNA (pseudouridine(1915)-N(3))-methyltransferase RlmH [SAR324 cluster bacterium]